MSLAGALIGPALGVGCGGILCLVIAASALTVLPRAERWIMETPADREEGKP